MRNSALSAQLVLPLHLKCISKHRKHLRVFGRLGAFLPANASAPALASARNLRALYQELLFWEPARKTSLHNYGIFLEDMMNDKKSATWLYDYGGFEMGDRNWVDQDSSSDNFREDLSHIPEELHDEARMDPRQICWPWNDPVKDAPSGTYRRQHVCLDESCPEPPTFDVHKEKWRCRGVYDGLPIPQLPGEEFDGIDPGH